MSDQRREPKNAGRPDEPVKTQGRDSAGRSTSSSDLFAPPSGRSARMPLSAWLIAGAVVLAVVAALLLIGHRKAPTMTGVQPVDPYAGSLQLSGLQMSESTSLAGGKSTFIDGRIRNAGSSTVTGVTVQVLFHNEEQMPPQVETLPLSLIRTREPYVDTEPIRAAPLNPGDEKEFRLIFESIPANWNMQMPETRVIGVDKK